MAAATTSIHDHAKSVLTVFLRNGGDLPKLLAEVAQQAHGEAAA